jgi:hypothetical protein
MARDGRVRLRQDQKFGPILVRDADGMEDEADAGEG